MKLADKPTVLKRPRAFRHTYKRGMWNSCMWVMADLLRYWIREHTDYSLASVAGQN